MKLKKLKVEDKIMIPIFIASIFISVFAYWRILKLNLTNKKFIDEVIAISEKNQEAVFKVEKIILISSASAIDNSEDKNLQDLSIYQYTDLAIYIDNGEELTDKNTIKNLYIDNITISTKLNKGTQSLRYKNFAKFGKSDNLDNNQVNRIDFNIICTNEENEKANYNEPTFYTDCSNPITLGYINQDLVTGYKIGENMSVSFDGKILSQAGINLNDIECKLKFKINIENNLNEKFSCWLNFKLPLDDVFEGVSMKSRTLSGTSYNFFCEQ